MKALLDLIAAKEDWLVERVLAYAGEIRCTADASALADASKEMVAGISSSLSAELQRGDVARPLPTGSDLAYYSTAGFATEEPARHKEVSLPPTEALCLLKCCRRAYLDLANTVASPAETLLVIDKFFDRAEIGMFAEWCRPARSELSAELRQAKVDITNQTNKLLKILESLPGPFLFVDGRRRVINLNRQAAALFYDDQPIDPHDCRDMELEIPAAIAVEMEQVAAAPAGVLEFTKDLADEEGERSYHVVMQPVLDAGGNFSGAAAMFSDVTHRKRLEERIETLNTDLAERAFQLEQANQELETFNYSVSHDLRTPLTGISGYCQFLLASCGDQLDSDCRGYVQEIFSTCERMNQQITAMLEFSRISRLEVHRELVDLTLLAESITISLRLENMERNVDFRLRPGVTAWGDPRLLRVVLENLLGNAWKFTADKEHAHIEFGTTDEGCDAAYFVRDNGAGFDMSQAAALFLPFQRLHDKDRYRGFGVGLATVERIIERHGGRLWATGEPGKGATFFFTIPGET